MTHPSTKSVHPNPRIPPSRPWGWIPVIIGALPILLNLLPILGAIVFSLLALVTMPPEEARAPILIFAGSGFALIEAVTCLPSVLFGGFFIFLGLKSLQLDKSFRTTGQLTQATITDKQTYYYFIGRRRYVTYEYQAYSPEGVPTHYQTSERYYREIPQQVGDSVPVRYLPHNPKICRLELDAHAPYSDS